jgi:hypothetical protein
MKTRQLPFFATHDDIVDVIRAVESSVNLKYVRTGLVETDHPAIYFKGEEIPSLGTAKYGDQNAEDDYLVLRSEEPVLSRAIAQTSGGVKYAFDQLRNPRSVVFRPGGRLDDRAIIAGRTGTASIDSDALALQNVFESAIKNSFSRIKSFWVGPEAQLCLDRGVRLTSALGSSLIYDLVR